MTIENFEIKGQVKLKKIFFLVNFFDGLHALPLPRTEKKKKLKNQDFMVKFQSVTGDDHAHSLGVVRNLAP